MRTVVLYCRAGCALVSFFILLFSFCTANRESNVESGLLTQTLHIGNGTEPSDLDPHTVTGIPEHRILTALMEGLVDVDPETLEPVPATASGWAISDDRRIYTFTIRTGARWSNGDTLSAADFVYAWKRVLSPGLGSEYAYMLYPVYNAEKFNRGEIKDFNKVGVKALGDRLLQVTLEHPTPYYLSLLAHYSAFPVHRATIEKFGAIDQRGTQWTRPGNLVGNGPFVLKKWDLNKIIVVEKSPTYWDADTVRLKAIHFHPVEQATTEERMFRVGQLHITHTLPAEKIEQYKNEDSEILRNSPYLGTYYYLLNTSKPPLNQAAVRSALALSIDREKLVEKVTRGGEISARSFTPPQTGGYTCSTHVNFAPYEAKALLAQAGYPDGVGFPEVEILYNTSEGHRKIAEAIQQMWKKSLNISVTLVNQDWKVYLDNRKRLNFDIARAGWVGDYADPNTFLDLFVSDGGNNHTGWSNASYDTLIARASRESNKEKRFHYFQEAEQILLDQMPVIPIYTYTVKYLVHRDVQGWYSNILDWHPYKYVWLER